MKIVSLYTEGDKLVWSVRLDSYHFRLSTDKLGCVAYGTVDASGQTNFHAVNLSGLEGSKCAFLSVGPAADPTKEQHSAFLELSFANAVALERGCKVAKPLPAAAPVNALETDVCNLAPFEPLEERSDVINIIASQHTDDFSLAVESHSPGAKMLDKYASVGMAVELATNLGSKVLSTTITCMKKTADDLLVLTFSDSISSMLTLEKPHAHMELRKTCTPMPAIYETAKDIIAGEEATPLGFRQGYTRLE